jgi:hypothetical protein
VSLLQVVGVALVVRVLFSTACSGAQCGPALRAVCGSGFSARLSWLVSATPVAEFLLTPCTMAAEEEKEERGDAHNSTLASTVALFARQHCHRTVCTLFLCSRRREAHTAGAAVLG